MHLQRRLGVTAAGLVAMAAIAGAEVRAQAMPMARITGDGGRYSVELPKGYTSTNSPRPS